MKTLNKDNNIFNIIRKQVVFNETQKLRGNDNIRDTFTIRGYYPEKIIAWITKKAKAFKIAKVSSDYDNGTRIYTIQYKDLNLYSEFLAQLYEKEEYKILKYQRKHEFDNLSVVEKALATNDKYRAELDCPNFDYKRYGVDNEYLEKADSCVFEIFLQKLGFDNYNEFAKYIETQNKDVSELIEEKYQEFLKSEVENQEYFDGTSKEGYIY